MAFAVPIFSEGFAFNLTFFYFQIAMDGGSPLACKKGENHYELGGLVTFGTSCSHDQSPSLFTNVSKHIKWIKENYDIMKRKRTE